MPAIALDSTDAFELEQLLDFLRGWLHADPATLAASLNRYVGNTGYDLTSLTDDISRFVFLLRGDPGTHLDPTLT